MIQFPGFMTPPNIVFIYYVPGGDSSSDWLNFSFTNLSAKAANCSIKIKDDSSNKRLESQTKNLISY